MKIREIRNQVNERRTKLESLNIQRQKLRDDNTLADHYKSEKLRELDEIIKDTRNNYDNEINNQVNDYRAGKTKALHNAKYEGLSSEQVNLELLKRMDNQQTTSEVLTQYNDGIYYQDTLLADTNKLVEENSPEAQGYINAIKQLGIDPLKYRDMERQYKENNLNSKQKEINQDLKLLGEVEQIFKDDLGKEAFQSKIDNYRQ